MSPSHQPDRPSEPASFPGHDRTAASAPARDRAMAKRLPRGIWYFAVTVFSAGLILIPLAPATPGLPMPRATTAACEVMPPCAVSTP